MRANWVRGKTLVHTVSPGLSVLARLEDSYIFGRPARTVVRQVAGVDPSLDFSASVRQANDHDAFAGPAGIDQYHPNERPHAHETMGRSDVRLDPECHLSILVRPSALGALAPETNYETDAA